MEALFRQLIQGAAAHTRSQAAGFPMASLDDVVQRMNSSQRVTKTAIRNTGLSKELAEHILLDLATAEASLQEVLNALGTQLGAEQ